MACCGETGLRISTILALVVSLGLSAYSAYLCHQHYEKKYSDTTRALDAVTNVFSTTSFTTQLNIKLFCTGAVAIGAGLQFLGSLLVVLCAGKNSSKLLIFANTFMVILLISVIACYFTAKVDYENDQEVQIFLGLCVLDLMILFIISCVAGAFLRN